MSKLHLKRGKAIVDTNLLLEASYFKKANVFQWIDQLYEEIILHNEVLNELILPSARTAVMSAAAQAGWRIFDQNNTLDLPDTQRMLYWRYVKEVQDGFENVRHWKEQSGLSPKASSNIGEIHSIALARLMNATIICSNDLEIKQVIEKEDFRISDPDSDEDILIEQHTLEDFCFYCVEARLSKPSLMMKFYKVCLNEDPEAVRTRKVEQFRRRLFTKLDEG